MLWKIKINILQILLSGGLLLLTYPDFNLTFFAWIAFVPLFFSLEDKSLRYRFFIGYIFGVIFFSGILYWLVNVTIPGAIVLILLLAISPSIFTSFYNPGMPQLLHIIAVPSIWVFTEFLRSHLLSGFPWALLGYSQSYNPVLIQISDITGAYGVSFLIIFINLIIYITLKRKLAVYKSLFIILFTFLSLYYYGTRAMAREYHTQNLKVASVQGNIPQYQKWDRRYRDFIVNKYKEFTKAAVQSGAKLIAWPETSLPGPLEDKNLKREISNLASSNRVYLLIGALRESEREYYNSAVLFDENGDIAGVYDKLHLVPFGEYIPFEKLIGWIRYSIDKPIGNFRKGNSFTVFRFKLTEENRSGEAIFKAINFYKFSALICFEDVFPDLVRRFVKNGANFLVNITNDAWFGKSSAPYQHAQGSIFRAVENRVPVIRSANTGVSIIIDHNGRIVSGVVKDGDDIFVEGVTEATIKPVYVKTFYTIYGDVFSWICILVSFVYLAISIFTYKVRPVL